MISLILNLEKVVYMKNRITIAFIFAVTMFFIGSYSVKAETTCAGPNLTSGLMSKTGQQVPQLCINGGMTYGVTGSGSTWYSHINYKNKKTDYNYIIVENNNTSNNYKYYAYILADYAYYNSGTTYRYVTNFNFDDSNSMYKNSVFISPDLNNINFSGIGDSSCYAWTFTYGTTLSSALEGTNKCSNGMDKPNLYNNQFNMIFRFRYNTTTTNWELDTTNYRPEQIYTYRNGTTPSILYSSFDIYTGTGNDATIYHNNDGIPTTPPDTSEYEKIKLYGMYGVLFKNKKTPTSEPGSSGGGHGGAINGKDFILYSKWGYTLNYWGNAKVHDSLSLHYNETLMPNYLTYWLEYNLPDNYNLVDNAILELVNITEDPSSDPGSSGSGHGGGEGRNFGTTYENDNPDIMRYVYFKNYKYDYCILETKDSECTFPDGSIGNNIYDNNDSSQNIFANLQKFINSKVNYINGFGFVINTIWNVLNTNIKGFIVTLTIIILTIFLFKAIKN
jgi:hypothetical protein